MIVCIMQHCVVAVKSELVSAIIPPNLHNYLIPINTTKNLFIHFLEAS